MKIIIPKRPDYELLVLLLRSIYKDNSFLDYNNNVNGN